MKRLALFAALLALSAPAAAGDYPTLYGTVGLGAGLGQGIAGASADLHLRSDSGFGASVEVGAGVAMAGGLRVWSPGEKFRVGIGPNLGVSWHHLQGKLPGCALSDPPQPSPAWQTLGGAVEADHDIGESGGFSLRYGVGGALVAAGCAGGILPAPTLAVRYTF